MPDNPCLIQASWNGAAAPDYYYSDITLRDLFAAAAVAGLAASPNGGMYSPDAFGPRAYAIADAMLAERTK